MKSGTKLIAKHFLNEGQKDDVLPFVLLLLQHSFCSLFIAMFSTFLCSSLEILQTKMTSKHTLEMPSIFLNARIL
jgi:hypothetical protein